MVSPTDDFETLATALVDFHDRLCDSPPDEMPAMIAESERFSELIRSIGTREIEAAIAKGSEDELTDLLDVINDALRQLRL